jgi:hypothetical protein
MKINLIVLINSVGVLRRPSPDFEENNRRIAAQKIEEEEEKAKD